MEAPIINFGVIALAALISLVVGFIWYHPNVFGKAWQKSAGLSDEDMKSGNMAVTFGVSYLMAIFAGLALSGIVIHQNGLISLMFGDPEGTQGLLAFLNENIADWGTRFRSFKHGALHGTTTGLFLVFPIFVIQGLYTKKSFKYIAISGGYWIVTLALMGGVICQFS